MLKIWTFFVCLVIYPVSSHESLNDRIFIHDTFPDGFAWSSATSSYQIEGGWNADGKGKNIWDTFTEQNGAIADGSSGKVACDSYHNFKEDVILLKSLGVKYYRFSLSWARLLPKGTPDHVNDAGVAYYNNLIDELLANGIEPQVTLYHWDLPQELADKGGWQNESIVDWFSDYANFSYETFGPKVKFWITFNEPWIICVLGYNNGEHAPGFKDTKGTAAYICGKNLLKAHAKAYSLYDRSYRTTASGPGKCGITLNIGYQKANQSRVESDVEAAERGMQFDLGWFAHPIFSEEGDYPEVMKNRVRDRSLQQNLTEPRLPAFSLEEINSLKGSSDFFGLNFYSGGNVVDSPGRNAEWDSNAEPNYWDDKAVGGGRREPSWTGSGSSWLQSTPELMRAVLVWIKEEYHNPEVYITENGFSDNTGRISDDDRVDYYKYYINNVLQAITIDKCNVKGYTAWSLLDNFEWAQGYTERFGLHHVDFSDPQRTRTAKDSARLYTQIIEDHGFPAPASSATMNRNSALNLLTAGVCFWLAK